MNIARNPNIKVAVATLAICLLPLYCSCSGTSSQDYRQDMRDFVQVISSYARSIQDEFILIPQNGNELITLNGEADGSLALKSRGYRNRYHVQTVYSGEDR